MSSTEAQANYRERLKQRQPIDRQLDKSANSTVVDSMNTAEIGSKRNVRDGDQASVMNYGEQVRQ